MGGDENNNAEFNNEVNLRGARIDGQLDMEYSRYTGKLDMESIHVGQYLFMIHTIFEEAKAIVDLNFATIGSLLLADSLLPTVELSGANIHWELRLASKKYPNTKWHEGAKLILRNTEVGAIHDSSDKNVWPKELELEGFTYSRLGGFEPETQKDKPNKENDLKSDSKPKKAIDWSEKILRMQKSTIVLTKELIGWFKNSLIKQKSIREILSNKMAEPKIDWSKFFEKKKDIAEDMAERDVEWFKQWLAKDRSYSPQPYEQLARVLRNAGHGGKADEILFAGKQRELREAGFLSTIWLFLQLVLIGYGYRLWFSIFWVIGFVTLGTFIFGTTQISATYNIADRIFYSLDMLLPIIELSKSYNEIILSGFPKYYFYFHKIMGYILAIYIGAGLSGITKK